MVRRNTIIKTYFAIIVIFVTVQILLFLLVKFIADDEQILSKDLVLPDFYENISLVNDDTDRTTVVKQITDFDPNRNWLVFFHIQKTSGTNFDREMVKHLHVRISKSTASWKKACSTIKIKRVVKAKTGKKNITVTSAEFECKRSNSNVSWILSWHETHWNWHCGLHPTLSDLKSCINDEYCSSRKDLSVVKSSNFYYLSMLREPVARFISEWAHVRKAGSLWLFEDTPKSESQRCSIKFFNECLPIKNSTNWTDIGLNEFISCRNNLAFNRQTRMLAEYDRKLGFCDYLYHSKKYTSYDEELLKRAKLGLLSLDFFGLKEYQEHSRLLFLRTFNNTFKFASGLRPKASWKEMSDRQKTDKHIRGLDKKLIEKIKSSNSLDLKVYKYAFELFVKRLKYFNVI